MKLQDTAETQTILGKIFTAIDPKTGTKFALENIRAHSDEFMYGLCLATLTVEPGEQTRQRLP